MVNRGFCSSVGFKYELDCSFFRRDVEDSVLDPLGGKREGCLLAGSTQRRPVLPSPAPPHRPAVRRADPTGPWCVRVLDSTSSMQTGQGTQCPVLRAVYQRDHGCSSFLAADRNDMEFICRIQNPDTPREGRVGRLTAGRLGRAGPAEWVADGFVRAGHNRPSRPPEHRRQLS